MHTVVARFFIKTHMLFFATQFHYIWILLAGRVNPMLILYGSMTPLSMLSQHHLTIYPRHDRTVPRKILTQSPSLVSSRSFSLSLSFSLFSYLFRNVSNYIKQRVPYLFTTFVRHILLSPVACNISILSAPFSIFYTLLQTNLGQHVLQYTVSIAAFWSSSPTPLKS